MPPLAHPGRCAAAHVQRFPEGSMSSDGEELRVRERAEKQGQQGRGGRQYWSEEKGKAERQGQQGRGGRPLCVRKYKNTEQQAIILGEYEDILVCRER